MHPNSLANNRWYTRTRALMIEKFGGKCEDCPSKEELEFAHREPTEVKGWGRGSRHRLYDVMKHPEKYRLLCDSCHLAYDRNKRKEAIANGPAL